MEYAYAGTDATAITQSALVEEEIDQSDEARRELANELMAPGHLYNSRTGTGIEWFPANPDTGESGRVRLWSRDWSGQPTVVAEGEHDTRSPWEYWYNLEFAKSFPQVTHWWFGDAWTGVVRIWQPEGVGRDPESGAPMLCGWLRFGAVGFVGTLADDSDDPDEDLAHALPWTAALTSPLRVSVPLPPMSVNGINLPLQLLLGETVLEMLTERVYRGAHGQHTADVAGVVDDRAWHKEVALTSLVHRADLQQAFPTLFGPWRLDRLPDLTAREALCRVLGLEPES